MSSATIDCQFRGDSPRGPVCRIVNQVTEISSYEISGTTDEICHACQNEFRSGREVNPVVGSLVYNAVKKVADQGGHPECSVERAHHLLRCASDQVSFVVAQLPEFSFPPAKAKDDEEVCGASLAVGMLTAPRKIPTIESSLQNVRLAGFSDIELFAEPGSFIPDSLQGLRIHQREKRLGNLLNFCSGLSLLLKKYPNAEAIAMFQDDISLARGTREWLETQLWPAGAGIVSLFTPRPHLDRKAGWHLRSPGFQRVCGAQALVFRRDTLEAFLSDPRVFGRLHRNDHCDDAVVAGWAARTGEKIAYHTPSLAGHGDGVSSIFDGNPDLRNFATPVSSVDRIPGWKESHRESRVGLMGCNTATGVGYQNRDLVKQGVISRWIVSEDDEPLDFRQIDLPRDRILYSPKEGIDERKLREWCRELDWLLFIESPKIPELVRVAAHAGAGIACVANWEWLQPEMDWLSFVDVMFCPTRQAEVMLNDWKERYGFGWRVIYLPWPVDATRFPFRQRRICEKFLYVNGWGGSWLSYPNGDPVAYRRKGLDIVLETARLAPELRFVIRSQEPPPSEGLPRNVTWLGAEEDNGSLYELGDVCVQPSRFEGLGLPLLECQAAGMPLVTTDAAPMNEHNPFRAVPTEGFEIVSTGPGPVAAHLVSSQALAETLRGIVGTNIENESEAARDFILKEHSWAAAMQTLKRELVSRG